MQSEVDRPLRRAMLIIRGCAAILASSGGALDPPKMPGALPQIRVIRVIRGYRSLNQKKMPEGDCSSSGMSHVLQQRLNCALAFQSSSSLGFFRFQGPNGIARGLLRAL